MPVSRDTGSASAYFIAHAIGSIWRPSHNDPDRIEVPGAVVVHVCEVCGLVVIGKVQADGKLTKEVVTKLVAHVVDHLYGD